MDFLLETKSVDRRQREAMMVHNNGQQERREIICTRWLRSKTAFKQYPPTREKSGMSQAAGGTISSAERPRDGRELQACCAARALQRSGFPRTTDANDTCPANYSQEKEPLQTSHARSSLLLNCVSISNMVSKRDIRAFHT